MNNLIAGPISKAPGTKRVSKLIDLEFKTLEAPLIKLLVISS